MTRANSQKTSRVARSLKRAAASLAVVSVLTLSPPMWLGSDPGSALAQDRPLGVTKGLDSAGQGDGVTSAQLIAASPMRAMQRFGAKQRNLLNRAAKSARVGRRSPRATRAQSMKPYRMRAARRVSQRPGGAGIVAGGATLQGLGRHEYLRLAGRLSGQRCESIEGGVLVRRGC